MNKGNSGANQENSLYSSLAIEKAKIVESLRGMRSIPSDKLIEACQAAGKLLNKPVGEVSHQTIRNWIRILEREGVAGFDHKPHHDRGKTQLSSEIERIIKGILLSPKRFSLAETHRRTERYARQFLKLPAHQIPTLKQVRFIWEHIPREDKVLALEGVTAYRRLFDQHGRFEAAHAGAIGQADHHQLDIIVVDQETGEVLGRPWITKIQDDYSRAILGYYLSLKSPGSMEIALALYHAFLPKTQEWWVMHGITNVLYVDHGKDYLSNHIQAVCLNFGIQLIAHEAYHPASKGKIENSFKTLEMMCIHPLDGSVGSNPQKRPLHVTPKLTLEELRLKIERYIKEYHERKHGTTKQRPLDRWLEDKTARRMVSKQEDIDHLLKSKPYVVHRDGIHFQYGHYRDPEHILAGFIGQKVTVFFNPYDNSRIRIWGNDDSGRFRYLCTAYPQPITEQPLDKDAMSEENKRRRTLVRQRVRDVQKEGKIALLVLDEDDAKRDAEAQQNTVMAETGDVIGHHFSTPPAAGLLDTRRGTAVAETTSTPSNEDANNDMLRRQLIRMRRTQL